jgi:hypothetical protein
MAQKPIFWDFSEIKKKKNFCTVFFAITLGLVTPHFFNLVNVANKNTPKIINSKCSILVPVAKK